MISEYEIKTNKLNWISIFYLLGVPVFAISFFPWGLHNHIFTWPMIVYALIHFSVDCLSVTVGYHRLFSHKSYEAHPILRALLLITGAGAFQNSALVWAKDHRIHHRDVDTDNDPYSIKKGFWYAHFLWMFKKDFPIDYEKLPMDLRKDKMIRIQDRYYLPLAILVGFGIPMLAGHLIVGSVLVGLYVGAILRLLASGHCTFCINSVAHLIGTRPFSLSNTARDNWFLSILTFGEGYHNYHHKFQADYRNGLVWYAWDPSKWIIYLLSGAGFTRNLIRMSPEKVLIARMKVSESKLGSSGVDIGILEKKRRMLLRLSKRMDNMRFKIENMKITGMGKVDRSERMLLVYKRRLKLFKRAKKKLLNQWTADLKLLRTFPRIATLT